MEVSVWACSFLLNDNVEYTLTNSPLLDSWGLRKNFSDSWIVQGLRKKFLDCQIVG